MKSTSLSIQMSKEEIQKKHQQYEAQQHELECLEQRKQAIGKETDPNIGLMAGLLIILVILRIKIQQGK